MNPLSLIPAQYQLLARIAVLVLLAGFCFGTGWKVKSAADGAAMGALRVEHEQAVATALSKSLAAQQKVTAEHDAKASALATIDTTHQQELTRLQDENDSLRAAVAAGSRVVRVRATCPDPGRPAGVPQTASGGSVDHGAGAVLDAEGGQAVLDLRAAAGRVDAKLPACQAALGCLTGQGSCPAPVATP